MTSIQGHAGLLLASNIYKSLVLASSPTLYLRLADLNTTAINIGSSGINGTYTTGYTQGQVSLCQDPTDFSVLFNGTSGYTSIGTSSDFQYASNFTYEAIIITPTLFTNTPAIISHGYLGPCVRLNTSGQLNLLKSYSVDRGNSTASLSASTRYHIAVTVDSSGISTFVINGVSSGNGTTASDYGSSTQALKVAVDTSSTGVISNYFGGTIDEVAIYNTALSTSVLLSHAQAAGLA